MCGAIHCFCQIAEVWDCCSHASVRMASGGSGKGDSLSISQPATDANVLGNHWGKEKRKNHHQQKN